MLLLGEETDGLEAFTIDESTGIIRTKVTLDHEERALYRLAISVRDNGRPPKETIRPLQIEVLDLSDNRPTFSTSSFAFKVCDCFTFCFRGPSYYNYERNKSELLCD